MTLKTETRFNIGEPVYFLNVNHEICKGIVSRIDSDTVVYSNTYTKENKTYTTIRYDIHTDDYNTDSYTEDTLYSTPDEIVAMFNDQIQQGDFN